MKRCGIDLGTTNSCIVVVEETGNRVIADKQGDKTFPSVVYMGSDGKPVIGHAARNRMGERPAPVATIKRKMGSTETVLLGGQERSAPEVSAMILTFLKNLAEQATGSRIDRAVVTVPAYFNHIQRQHTDEAARQAGFREVVTLLEPVAAALAYSLENQSDQLRVFVYDLGGGTFDATVLEKDPHGGLTVLSFGGDPYLGGDDIDSRLAKVILGRLVAQGFSLNLDLQTPEDFSRYQRLKFYAENAKKALTSEEQVQLARQGLFEDKEGVTVDLDLTITRQDLEDCCRDLVQRTIEASLATLNKDGREIPLASIDEVIMVGGMSRMPLVRGMVAAAFGKEPRLVDPDLIVGLGAAAKAAEVFPDREQAASGLEVEIRYERRTDQDRTRITGIFNTPLRGHMVYLLTPKSELFQSVDGTDRFSFENIPLTPDSTNVFTLAVEDSNETPVLEREIRVVQDSKSSPVLASPGSVVTKAISIGTVSGPHVLFPENTSLPYTMSYGFETADQSGRIVAPIFEAANEVERLEIHDIPPDLPVGTPVIIEVSIRADYHFEARAVIPDLKREVSIDFQIKAIDTRHITPEFVRQRLVELEEHAKRAVADCVSPEAAQMFGFRFEMTKDQIRAELSELEPKAIRLHELLTGAELLIRSLPARNEKIELKPTHQEFSERLTEVVTNAMENKHPRLAELTPKIEEIRGQAADAWARKDPVAWKRVNSQVASLASLLRPELSDIDKALGTAAWLVQDEIPQLRAAARGRFESEIGSIEEETVKLFHLAQSGLMPADQAYSKLQSLYDSGVRPLCEKLGLTAKPTPAATPRRTGDGALRVAGGRS